MGVFLEWGCLYMLLKVGQPGGAPGGGLQLGGHQKYMYTHVLNYITLGILYYSIFGIGYYTIHGTGHYTTYGIGH